MKRMSRALKMVTGPKTYGVGLRAIPYTWNRIQSSGSVCHSPVTACGRPYVIYLSSSHSLRALEIKVNHFCFALLCSLSFVLILCLEDSGTRLSDVAHLWSSTSFIHSSSSSSSSSTHDCHYHGRSLFIVAFLFYQIDSRYPSGELVRPSYPRTETG